MNPSSMPGWGSAPDYGAELKGEVANIAPLAPTWHGAQNGVDIPYIDQTPAPKSQGVLPAFWGHVESVFKETGHLAAATAGFIGHSLENIATAPVHYGESLGHGIVDRINVDSLNQQASALSDRMDSLTNSYKTGQISKSEYVRGLNELNQDNMNVSKQLAAWNSKTGSDFKGAINSTIDMAGDVVTVMSLGTAAAAATINERAAASLLESASTLNAGAEAISKLATDEAAWKAVTPTAQAALRLATQQTLEAAGKQASGAQISRAVAANLLLKYPLTYNAVAGTGHQLYEELDNNKYGDAVKTSAFNAALLLGGGVIGWGLKYGGKALKALSVASSLRPGGILDELSSHAGDGDKLALGRIAARKIAEGKQDEVKAMIVGLESNLKRTNGNTQGAISNIVAHLEQYVGWGSLHDMTHEQLWDNMVNYWKHAEGLEKLKKAGLIEGVSADDARAIVPGRFTTQDKNLIAAAVTKGDLPVTTPRVLSAEKTAAKTEKANGAIISEQSTSAVLPKELRGAKPNYNYGSKHFELSFEDDTAKALYIVAQKTPSARDADYMAFLRKQFPDKSDAEIRGLGQTVKDNIKAEARTSTNDVIKVASPVTSEAQSYANVFGVDEKTAQQELATPSEAPEPTTEPIVQRTKADRLQAWQAFKQANPNIAAANNPNVDKQITHLIETIDDSEELASAINKIPTQIGLDGVPKEYAAQMAKDGYVAIIPKSHNLPVVPFEETPGKLATNGAEGDFFVKTATPVPVLRQFGTLLSWAGLSPEMAQTRVQDVFRGNFAVHIADLGAAGAYKGADDIETAQNMLGRLYEYMKAPTGGMKILGHYVPITDMRQLSTNDIVRALGVGKSQAKEVQNAIMQSYLDVPRSIAGLGDKIVDRTFKYNPLMKGYLRIQGATRFSWNPIFRNGRLPLKAEILAQMDTGGKFPTVAGTNTFMKLFFPGQYKEIDAIVDNPKFKELLPGGLGGEAAERYGSDVEQMSAKDIKSKEQYPRNALRPVAGMIRSMANRVGLDVDTYIEQYPQQVQDAATALLHYDHNNSFLNSPMAKTLNVAFFPFRFNVKVTTYMAKFLAKQEPIVQYAAVKGIMDAHQFLNSPQGMAWYSQNSDAIGLFKYFSPLETISTISNALGLKHDSTGEYGELGGLPFGWIPLMLDSVGLTHFGQAYVNPKTGVIAKDYVPTNMYGAANAAIQDLLSSLFTYPGATAGLPSKGKVGRTIVGGLLPGSADDFTPEDPTNVTPEEKRFSQVVQQMNGTAPVKTKKKAQKTGSVKVPVRQSVLTVPRPKSSSSHKKKSQFTPALLPGQSRLGEL